jgi:hypothetical protein
MATIKGDANDNVLFGLSSQADYIYGYGGDDRLQDRADDYTPEADRFYGGGGNDLIKSTYGSAWIDGGSGADRFEFRAGKTDGNAWNATIYMDENDFLTLNNTDDGVHWSRNADNDSLTAFIDVEGGAESIVTIRGVDGYDPLLADIDLN